MRKSPGIPNELFTYERKKRHWTQGDVADKISAPDERLIRRWERGEVAPTPHYRGKLAELFGRSARELGFPPDGQISFWHVPYRRNAFFTGREGTLQLLLDTFLSQQASPVPRLPLALSGLGGMGKSQIALEYAYRYREYYHTVLWLNAAARQSLVADVTAIADLLDLPGKDAARPNQLIEALKDHLTQLTRWLLIFDNVEDFQLLEDFLPAEIKGQVLLTTRSQNTGTSAQPIAVEPMDSDTGAELLLRRAKLIKRIAIESTLEHTAAADATIARSLSEDMGGLPLALDQAGAYIEEAGVSLTDYITLYHEQRRRLLNRRGIWVSENSEHPETVATTFELSFTKACEQHPLVTDILHFCAFLQPDAIPEELYQHDDSFTLDTIAFNDGITALRRYSLIERNAQDKTFSIHRLVQAVLIDGMLPETQKQWQQRVVRALNTAFPKVALKNWRLCERLVLHVLLCATWDEDELAPMIEAATIFHKTAIHLRDHMFTYSTAETLLERAVAIYEQLLGVVHPSMANALYDLAVIYHWQDNYSHAERTYAQIVGIWERLVGTSHLKTARSLHNLLALYLQHHKNDSAEAILGEALCPHQQDAGTGYSETAQGLHKLAYTFLKEGDCESIKSAYDLIELMISVQTKCLGDHPETARSFCVWALLHESEYEYELAEALYREALTIFEDHLEADNPDITSSLTALARVLHNQDRHEEAEALYQRALHSQEWQSGATHPLIQNIKMQYASFLRNLGRDADAAALEMNNEPPV